MPSNDHASRSRSRSMIRVVMATPRSARMSASSSSSQSIGLFANVCASASKKFIEEIVSRDSRFVNRKSNHDLTNHAKISHALGPGFVRRLAKRTFQVVFHSVEDTVYKTTGLAPAESFCELYRFIDGDHRRDVVAVEHFIS